MKDQWLAKIKTLENQLASIFQDFITTNLLPFDGFDPEIDNWAEIVEEDLARVRKHLGRYKEVISFHGTSRQE